MTNTLISKITAASKAVGALKADKTNTSQNYSYISADKILERAGDALANNGVALIPALVEESTVQVDYTDNYGKPKSRFDALVKFIMTLTDGETQMEIPWCGRGSDFAVPDKALYKAITSGHKYFLMKLLNVGVGNEDGEHETDAQAAQDATPTSRTAQATRPQGAQKAANGTTPQPRQVDADTGGIKPQRRHMTEEEIMGIGRAAAIADGDRGTLVVEGDTQYDGPTDDELEVLGTWRNSQEAQAWAVEVGACDNLHHAGESWVNSVKANRGFSTKNAGAVYLHFLRHQNEKLTVSA